MLLKLVTQAYIASGTGSKNAHPTQQAPAVASAPEAVQSTESPHDISRNVVEKFDEHPGFRVCILSAQWCVRDAQQ